jgi:hypothetical protein
VPCAGRHASPLNVRHPPPPSPPSLPRACSHQEDSNWPLQEGAKLKERFDAIFESSRYTKALEDIRKQRKEKHEAWKEAAATKTLQAAHYNRRRRLVEQLAEHAETARQLEEGDASLQAQIDEAASSLADMVATRDATAASRQRLVELQSSLSAQEAALKSLAGDTARLRGKEREEAERLLAEGSSGAGAGAGGAKALETEAAGLAGKLAQLDAQIGALTAKLGALRGEQSAVARRAEALSAAAARRASAKASYEAEGREFIARAAEAAQFGVSWPAGAPFTVRGGHDLLEKLQAWRATQAGLADDKAKEDAAAVREVEAKVAAVDAVVAAASAKIDAAKEEAVRAERDVLDAETALKAAERSLGGRRPEEFRATHARLERDLGAARGGGGVGAGVERLRNDVADAAREVRGAEDVLAAAKAQRAALRSNARFVSDKAAAEGALARLSDEDAAFYNEHRDKLAGLAGLKTKAEALGQNAGDAVRSALSKRQAEQGDSERALAGAKRDAAAAEAELAARRGRHEAARERQLRLLTQLQELQAAARGKLSGITGAAVAVIARRAAELVAEARAARGGGGAGAGSAAAAVPKESAYRIAPEMLTFITQAGVTHLGGGAPGAGAGAPSVAASGALDLYASYSGYASLEALQYGAGAGASAAAAEVPLGKLGPVDAVPALPSFKELADRLERAAKGAEAASVDAQALPTAYGAMLAGLEALLARADEEGSIADISGTCECCGRPFHSRDELEGAVEHLRNKKAEAAAAGAGGASLAASIGAGKGSGRAGSTTASLAALREASSTLQALSRLVEAARTAAAEYAESARAGATLEGEVNAARATVVTAREALETREKAAARAVDDVGELRRLAAAMGGAMSRRSERQALRRTIEDCIVSGGGGGVSGRGCNDDSKERTAHRPVPSARPSRFSHTIFPHPCSASCPRRASTPTRRRRARRRRCPRRRTPWRLPTRSWRRRAAGCGRRRWRRWRPRAPWSGWWRRRRAPAARPTRWPPPRSAWRTRAAGWTRRSRRWRRPRAPGLARAPAAAAAA